MWRFRPAGSCNYSDAPMGSRCMLLTARLPTESAQTEGRSHDACCLLLILRNEQGARVPTGLLDLGDRVYTEVYGECCVDWESNHWLLSSQAHLSATFLTVKAAPGLRLRPGITMNYSRLRDAFLMRVAIAWSSLSSSLTSSRCASTVTPAVCMSAILLVLNERRRG